MRDAKITGSLSQAAYDSLKASFADIMGEADSLSSLLRGDTDMKIDQASKSAIQANLDRLMEEKIKRINAFILKYPESQVGVFEISDLAYLLLS